MVTGKGEDVALGLRSQHSMSHANVSKFIVALLLVTYTCTSVGNQCTPSSYHCHMLFIAPKCCDEQTLLIKFRGLTWP